MCGVPVSFISIVNAPLICFNFLLLTEHFSADVAVLGIIRTNKPCYTERPTRSKVRGRAKHTMTQR